MKIINARPIFLFQVPENLSGDISVTLELIQSDVDHSTRAFTSEIRLLFVSHNPCFSNSEQDQPDSLTGNE